MTTHEGKQAARGALIIIAIIFVLIVASVLSSC